VLATTLGRAAQVGPKNSALVSSFYYISELRILARYAGIDLYQLYWDYISRRAMPLHILECQVSKMGNSDTCPRPTTGLLDKPTDQARYTKLASAAATAFNAHFFNAANATYAEPGRTCGEVLQPHAPLRALRCSGGSTGGLTVCVLDRWIPTGGLSVVVPRSTSAPRPPSHWPTSWA
jgi:hypothetical protein